MIIQCVYIHIHIHTRAHTRHVFIQPVMTQNNTSAASLSLLTWESLASWSALSTHLSRHTRCTRSAGGPLRSIFSRRPGTPWWGHHLHRHLYAWHVVGHSLCAPAAARSRITISVKTKREKNIHTCDSRDWLTDWLACGPHRQIFWWPAGGWSSWCRRSWQQPVEEQTGEKKIWAM